MKNRFSPFFTAFLLTACASAPAGSPPAESGASGVIFTQNFDGSALGKYTGERLDADWDSPLWSSGFDEGRAQIVDTGSARGRALEITFTGGAFGPKAGASFLSDIPLRAVGTEGNTELYLSYDIQFGPEFEFVKGGKLPGLCGFNTDQAPNEGCNTGGGFPTGYDGWSARGMWRAGGALENYVYNAAQKKFYGDSERWGVKAKPGQWHTVRHRVVLNTPGESDGILEAWLDGDKVLSMTDVKYRNTEEIGVNLFYFSTFFGGNTQAWAPESEQTLLFDNFVISTPKAY